MRAGWHKASSAKPAITTHDRLRQAGPNTPEIRIGKKNEPLHCSKRPSRFTSTLFDEENLSILQDNCLQAQIGRNLGTIHVKSVHAETVHAETVCHLKRAC